MISYAASLTGFFHSRVFLRLRREKSWFLYAQLGCPHGLCPLSEILPLKKNGQHRLYLLKIRANKKILTKKRSISCLLCLLKEGRKEDFNRVCFSSHRISLHHTFLFKRSFCIVKSCNQAFFFPCMRFFSF